jgi:hypothetical protein
MRGNRRRQVVVAVACVLASIGAEMGPVLAAQPAPIGEPDAEVPFEQYLDDFADEALRPSLPIDDGDDHAGGGGRRSDPAAEPDTTGRQFVPPPDPRVIAAARFQQITSGPVLEPSTGRVFVIADGRLRAFDRTGREVRSVPSPVGAANLSSAGGLFLSGNDVTAHIDPITLEVEGSYAHTGVPMAVGGEIWFAQRTQWTVVDQASGATRVISDPLLGPSDPFSGPARAWYTSALGSRILHATPNGLRTVDVASGEPVTVASLPNSSVAELGSDGTLFTYELDSTIMRRTIEFELLGTVAPGNSFRYWAPEARLVFVADPGEGLVSAWRPEGVEPLLTLPGLFLSMAPIAVMLPDGSAVFTLASGVSGPELILLSLAPTVTETSTAVFRPQWTPEVSVTGELFDGVTAVRVNGSDVPFTAVGARELRVELRGVAPAARGVLEVENPLGSRRFIIPGEPPRGSAIVAIWSAALDDTTAPIRWNLRCENVSLPVEDDLSLRERRRPGVVDLVLVPAVADCTVTFPDRHPAPTRVALYDPDDLISAPDLWENAVEFVSGRPVLVAGFARDPAPPRVLWLFADGVGGAPEGATYRVRIRCGTWRTTVTIREGFGVRVEAPSTVGVWRRCVVAPERGRGVRSVQSVGVRENNPIIGDERGRITDTLIALDSLDFVIHRFDHGGADAAAAVAVGAPGESFGRTRGAGLVHLLPTRGDGSLAVSAERQLRQALGLPGPIAGGAGVGSALVVGDFDRDGREDLAIGVPGARVGRHAAAGVVVVVYDHAAGRRAQRQVLDRVRLEGAGGAGAGDRFGAALAVVDFDGDGVDDLAIGAPGSRVGRTPRAGEVIVVPGSPQGLDRRVDVMWSQRDVGERPERGDAFGSVLAGRRGLLVVGVPNESVGRLRRAGVVHRIHGPSLRSTTLSRDRPMRGDSFGAAVDVDADGHVLVGAPGATVDGRRRAGVVVIYTLGRNSLDVVEVNQGFRPAGPSFAAGNRFGAAVRFLGARNAQALVGAPGSTVLGRSGAGSVHLVDDRATFAGRRWIDATNPGMPIGPTAGAGLGSTIEFGRRGQLLLGVPGLGPRRSGAFLVFAGDEGWTLVDQDSAGIDERREAGDRFGAAMAG